MKTQNLFGYPILDTTKFYFVGKSIKDNLWYGFPPFVMKIKNKSKTLEKISNQFWGVIYRFYNMSSIARTDRENVLKPQKPVSPRPPAPLLL